MEKKYQLITDPQYQGKKLTSEEFDATCELIMNLAKFKNFPDDQSIWGEIINFKARRGIFNSKAMWNAVISIVTISDNLLTCPMSTASAECNR